MPTARLAVALYLALGLHLGLALVLLLEPDTGSGPGPGTGPGLGLRLQGPDSVLAPRPASAPQASASTQARVAEKPTPSDAQPGAVPRPGATRPVERRGPASAGGEDSALAGGGGGMETYYSRLRAHLHRHRRELAAALSSASTEVWVEVAPDGRVSGLRLAQASGIDALDREALELVRRAQPLPVPPGGRALTVVIPVYVGR